ncbi:unnamed protein product [Toxocara canis]|uniref:5'-nucleotidase n=1 Tax=Toxocara canis TaxID=6265 RepID=A0A183U9I8_TOXCA|nr:unnamed protein product [Toxocara canis]
MGEDCSRFGYAQMKTGNFVQEAPVLHNPFDDDPILEKALKKLLPPKVHPS